MIDPHGFGQDGGYTITRALKDGLKAAGNDRPATISVKIAKDRPMFKIGPWEFCPKRAHWTHLAVKIDEQGKTTATHTDSKGFAGRVYNLDKVREAVSEVFPGTKLETKYTGHQGFLDNSNCGRFAAAYEDATCTKQQGIAGFDQTKTDPLQHANSNMQVDARCNGYEAGVLAKRESRDLDAVASPKAPVVDAPSPRSTHPAVEAIRGQPQNENPPRDHKPTPPSTPSSAKQGPSQSQER